MFTGLVECLGKVRRIDRSSGGGTLSIEAPFTHELARGDSVAVNGVCLTVVHKEAALWSADVSAESLARTSLGRLRPGDAVNLERALAVGQRLGGHYVLGHVDAVSEVLAVTDQGTARRIDIGLPPSLAPLVVEKGSIAIDGISLTINGVGPDRFWVAVIPETWSRTTLGLRKPGSPVHLEADIIGKYVVRMLELRGGPAPGERSSGGGLSEAWLASHGYR